MLEPLRYTPPPGGPLVLHQDADLLLVNKPAGLLSVPGKSPLHCACLESRVKQAFPGALLVHRLDMDTSGIMVFALNKRAQRHLGLQFERRYVSKTYIAILSGALAPEEGEVDLPLIADWPDRPLQKVCHKTGKPAQTRWRVLSRDDAQTVVRLFPKTGRSHQLRVHMLALGHPILGDRFYGDATSAARLMLHAEGLEFHHPTGGDRFLFEAPCPFWP